MMMQPQPPPAIHPLAHDIYALARDQQRSMLIALDRRALTLRLAHPTLLVGVCLHISDASPNMWVDLMYENDEDGATLVEDDADPPVITWSYRSERHVVPKTPAGLDSLLGGVGQLAQRGVRHARQHAAQQRSLCEHASAGQRGSLFTRRQGLS